MLVIKELIIVFVYCVFCKNSKYGVNLYTEDKLVVVKNSTNYCTGIVAKSDKMHL